MSNNAAQKLAKLGQSIWYDNISKELLNSGELARLISEWGVRGLTSNPTIFDNAISNGSLYDADISVLKKSTTNADEIFEELAVADLSKAADLLLPVFESSGGEDGFVSIEVSPLLASDTNGTIAEARRLFQKVNRPNVMVKIPGTPDGIPAIRKVLEAGICVNVTLLFSVENYREVANAYISALESRIEKGLPVDKIRSVASFFVSRVDSAVDKELKNLAGNGNPEAKELMGKFGIANSRMAYQEFKNIFNTSSFNSFKEKGANVQRPLWASTSTKDPSYRDVLYVEQLIGKDTVNTLPPKTLEAFVDHGHAEITIENDVSDATELQGKLWDLGINVSKILSDLQKEGVGKFVDSFHSLNASIEKQLKA